MNKGSLLGVIASALLLTSACTRSGTDVGIKTVSARPPGPCEGSGDSAPAAIRQASPQELKAARLDRLPVAPTAARVDLMAPAFSDSTNVTNPLFPIARLHSAILNGQVDGRRFKVETTLLPETRIIEWSEGECVETLVSQYVAYLDGRIEEVALDLYAQADDGSVWYFGEDVFNYRNGMIADTDGTWIAGRDGPPAMIMPVNPEPGDVYRPENILGLVFEEVTVKEVGHTVRGPSGTVEGAMVSRELHNDGTLEEKVFAPGYGEFFTGSGGDVEAIAIAVPTDARREPLPSELRRISRRANDVVTAVQLGDRQLASSAEAALESAWTAYRRIGNLPPRLRPPMHEAIEALATAVAQRDDAAAGRSALDVAHAALDLQLQYRPPVEIDTARFELWARRVLLDIQIDNRHDVLGDVAVLEWIRDRLDQALDSVTLIRIDNGLIELRTSAGDKDFAAAAAAARRLSKVLPERA